MICTFFPSYAFMHLCVYAFSILIALLVFSGCGAEAYLWQAGGEISSTAGVMGMGSVVIAFQMGENRGWEGVLWVMWWEKYVLEHKFLWV